MQRMQAIFVKIIILDEQKLDIIAKNLNTKYFCKSTHF